MLWAAGHLALQRHRGAGVSCGQSATLGLGQRLGVGRCHWGFATMGWGSSMARSHCGLECLHISGHQRSWATTRGRRATLQAPPLAPPLLVCLKWTADSHCDTVLLPSAELNGLAGLQEAWRHGLFNRVLPLLSLLLQANRAQVKSARILVSSKQRSGLTSSACDAVMQTAAAVSRSLLPSCLAAAHRTAQQLPLTPATAATAATSTSTAFDPPRYAMPVRSDALAAPMVSARTAARGTRAKRRASGRRACMTRCWPPRKRTRWSSRSRMASAMRAGCTS